MQVHFRRAAASEIDLVLLLMQEYYAHDRLTFNQDTARTALASVLDDDARGSLWLIQRGADTIGYMALLRGWCLEFGGRILVVDELFLRDGYRRRGIGARALTFAAEVARSLGAGALRLEVERANDAARRLYEREGFHPHDRVLMTRPLAPAVPP
jgi:GNAT superfamily N-acetyltransferase